MPRLSKRERAVRELRVIAETGGAATDPNFERFLACPKLQQASRILAHAAESLGGRGGHSAFTADTRTPLPAPPGWLPPPI